MTDKCAPSSRHQYTHAGRVVYEWDQTLSEINIYVEVPPGVRGKMIYCDISRKHLRLGITPNPPYLDLGLFGLVRADECVWTLEDSTLHVFLDKLNKGETWKAAFVGHEVDEVTATDDQKRLMLERFQEENPGFDFSDAEFNGQVPDPQTFMKNLSPS
eukprot:CAMPEP_0177778854 /NCGR_PEP_ID=MMETSP0491_2-20121128/16205_1 /TAXON_ID=63592 /ORGANISM="Tetraselmis chuii, Strain PLY429" /LENGTH=157 /DNA_ID=CAMNT_0019298213 /DNA_START=107 /DNA_END=580 /DNA_ORIENTATION=+